MLKLQCSQLFKGLNQLLISLVNFRTKFLSSWGGCDTPGKPANDITYLALTYLAFSVSAYQISGRNFFLVGDTVTTRNSNLLCASTRVYMNCYDY
ncbi:hypothetical protein HanIR_Chr04g0181781 [Helianthus annuus]|nr:hypothetical protein HanIR_Chr04g0181781 [Helianthus annuus]